MYIDSVFNNWKFKNCLILVISKYNVKKIKLIFLILNGLSEVMLLYW